MFKVFFLIDKTHTALEIEKLQQNFAMLYTDAVQRDLEPKLKANNQLLQLKY